MSESHTPAMVPAMVPASNVVASIIESTSRIIGAGTIAKQQGTKIANVKVAHAQQQGAAVALAAMVTKRGRVAVLENLAAAQLDAIVNPHGVIDFARAIPTVLGADLAFSYAVDIRADGGKVVRRAVWLALFDHLTTLKAATGKTGKATPQAKASERALSVWVAIQARADQRRAMSTPAIEATGNTAPEGLTFPTLENA